MQVVDSGGILAVGNDELMVGNGKVAALPLVDWSRDSSVAGVVDVAVVDPIVSRV